MFLMLCTGGAAVPAAEWGGGGGVSHRCDQDQARPGQDLSGNNQCVALPYRFIYRSKYVQSGSVFRIRIRIHRIHVFLGLPDPDPLDRGMDLDPDPALDPDPDPSIIKQI